MKNAATTTKQLRTKPLIPDRIKVFLFMLPLIVYVFTFAYKPLWGWSYAFVSYKPGRDVLDCAWRGMKNFTDLFGNPILRRNIFNALTNTLVVQAFGYILYPLPMLFAIFLSEVRSKKFQKTVQTLSSLPHFVSWVVVSALLQRMFSPYGGLINEIRMVIDPNAEAIHYLGETEYFYYFVILSDTGFIKGCFQLE